MAPGAWGCDAPPAEDDTSVVAATQQLRAGRGTDGQAFIAVDLLATMGGTNRILTCAHSNLDLTLAYSTTGEGGPFVEFATEEDLDCSAVRTGDFALVIDNSGSEEAWLEQLRDASHNILAQLLPSGGRASLVRVSTDAKVLSEVTWDRDVLYEHLDGMHINAGWTALYDGIRIGNETLQRADPQAGTTSYPDAATFCDASRKLGIVAVTDGRDNNSSNERLLNEMYPGDGVDTTMADLYDLEVAGVTTPIYTIGMGDEVEHDELADLALSTGGRHMPIASPANVSEAFELISEYASGRHQFCTTLPEPVCGEVHVRVHHTITVGTRGGSRGGPRGGSSPPTDEIIAVNIPCLPGE